MRADAMLQRMRFPKWGAGPAMKENFLNHEPANNPEKNGSNVPDAGDAVTAHIRSTRGREAYASIPTWPPWNGSVRAVVRTSLGHMILTPTSLVSASGWADLIGRPACALEHILVILVSRPAARRRPAAGRHHNMTINKMLKMFQIPAQHRHHHHQHHQQQKAQHDQHQMMNCTVARRAAQDVQTLTPSTRSHPDVA